MRRFILRIAAVTFLLTAMAASGVLAAPAAQDRYGTLESLSSYFPSDTILYAASRTNINLVTSLDQLMHTVETQIPQGMIPPEFPKTLSAALDLLAKAMSGGTFANTVRPWLGDTIAVGIYPAIRSAGGRIVIKITDAKAALDALSIAFPDWSHKTVDGYTLLTNEESRIAIYSDVLIIYAWSDDVGPQPDPKINPNPSLNRNAALLSHLPSVDYDMIALVDTPLLLAYSARDSYHSEGDWIIPAAILRSLGIMGIGVHIGADHTVTVDVVQSKGNTVGLEALGIQFTGQGMVLPPNTLPLIPRDAFFVGQVADVGSMLEFVGSSAHTAAKKFQTVLPSLITSVAYGYSASTAGLFSGAFSSIINTEWANVFFSNLSGYDYNREIRPLIGGSSTFFLSFNPSYDPNSPIYVNRELFEGGVVFDTSDEAAALAFVSKLQRELAISIYSSGDQHSARIQEISLPGSHQGVSLTIYGETGQPFDEFVAAAYDTHVIIGTRRAVTQVLSGDNVGFDTGIVDSSTSMRLVDAGMAFYLNMPSANSPYWSAFTQSDPGNPPLQLLPYFVQNATLSIAGSSQNDLLMRLTVTLPCGDNCG